MNKSMLCRIGLTAVVLIMVVFILTACKEKKTTAPIDESGVVAGTVFTPDRSTLSGVTVAIGDKSTTTDSNGRFFLTGIDPATNVKVDFNKSGYIPGQKVVKVEKSQTTYTSCTLFTPVTSQFSAAQGSMIMDAGTYITLPENAFVTPSGAQFNGTVQAEMRYFDPTYPQSLDAFPGSFSGVLTNGNEVMFESFGFLYASFRDASNPTSVLQLANGKTAQIQSLIPSSLLPNAPETIPIWYYNDTTGKWMEDGSATKTGSYYICEVSHFTFWNFDYPITVEDQSTLTGQVVSSSTKSPVAGAQVVATGVNYSGYTLAYTNSSGVFSITVKASAQVRLQAFAGINASTPSAVINTPASGGTLDTGVITIQDLSFTIVGKLVDASGVALSQGYGQLYQINPPDNEEPFQAWIYLAEDGTFNVSALYIGGLTSFNVQFRFDTRSSLYSATIPFTVPQPGQVRNFGNVTMKPGGNLNGRARDNAGNWIANASVYFMQEGGQGEGTYFSSNTDADGNFTLQGPPNTTLTNMRGNVYVNEQSYSTQLMTLTFPGSGANSNLGTVVFSP